MIKSFGSPATAALYHGYERQARSLPPEIWKTAGRKLDMLHSAASLRDLLSPPGNRLEKLTGKRDGWYSIRINDQFRIIFRFEDGNAYEVEVTDYH